MAVDSTAIIREGLARTPDGAVYITIISDAVPAGAVMREGFAYAPDGSLYVKIV